MNDTPLIPGDHGDCTVKHYSPKENGGTRLNGGANKPAVLPELVINESDPTATAKELAALIAKKNDFLSNGYVPIKIASDDATSILLITELGRGRFVN